MVTPEQEEVVSDGGGMTNGERVAAGDDEDEAIAEMGTC